MRWMGKEEGRCERSASQPSLLLSLSLCPRHIIAHTRLLSSSTSLPSCFIPPQLCNLYENDSIFDKFDCCINGQGTGIATGSYNNLFRVFGTWNGTDMTLESSRDPMRKRLQAPASKVRTAFSHASVLLTLLLTCPFNPPLLHSHTHTYTLSTSAEHPAWRTQEQPGQVGQRGCAGVRAGLCLQAAAPSVAPRGQRNCSSSLQLALHVRGVVLVA